jgi:hypothetical protein
MSAVVVATKSATPQRKLYFPPPSRGRIKVGALLPLGAVFENNPHPSPPPAWGREKRIEAEGAHHSDPPSVPLVDGTASDFLGSISIACRSARASPLKQLSTIWWLFSP